MKKLKGEGNFPSYFDNGDVVLHIFAKFQIWNWLRRNIVVRKNQLFLYCYTKLSLSRRTGNQYLSSWNNLLNNFLSRLMFQYSFVLKSITCIIYLIEKETSSEKIEKLYELSLILKSHACQIVAQNVIRFEGKIFRRLSTMWYSL